MGYKISRISLFFCSWPVSQWGVSVNTWKFEEMYLVVTRQLFEAIGWAAARWKAHSILNNCGWSDEPSRHLYAIYQPYSSRFKYTVGPANDRYEMFDVIKKKNVRSLSPTCRCATDVIFWHIGDKRRLPVENSSDFW